MIQLPDFEKAFDYENNFYLASAISRMYKPIIHYELYKKVLGVPGAFVELGIFKGISFVRFLAYREMIDGNNHRKFIGFDAFGHFPKATLDSDKKMLSKFLEDAGDQSISKTQLETVLERKGVEHNVELISGNINETVPKFIEENPDITLSLIHLDVDLYEPSVTSLEYLFPRLSKGGILILDDYKVWEGESKAVDEYFADTSIQIRSFPFAKAPSYIIKE
ncbi:TylF/MycF/NovP-related O-methyltransferase [Robiginitalea aurantiaca]|uniref:TylF/MycF/NovP-related O-methyltransferase n=1 Tax=Robiginitalea aurantiaca TaxID=3056915 RepID=A0ABT7WE10_9FLAO|nr:TylF/MycF/NovP-related O-methyltransferase [Robiginitalea aurantiaca]MDM9631151.1 TylF/MycF/NovP-related O-methyltransferase [Robiginitalea aurantiaca]